MLFAKWCKDAKSQNDECTNQTCGFRLHFVGRRLKGQRKTYFELIDYKAKPKTAHQLSQPAAKPQEERWWGLMHFAITST